MCPYALPGRRNQGLSGNDSSVSFKVLQKRIEGIQQNDSLPAISITGGISNSNRSFSNPLFDNRELLETDATLREENEQTNYLKPTSLNSPLPKVESSSSIKSIRSNKSFKSLLGLNKASFETPMVDFMVDIGKEASNWDTLEGKIKDEETNNEQFAEMCATSDKNMGKVYKYLSIIFT